MSRSLKRRELITEKLRDFILELQLRDIAILPAERELCAELGASRETVRRALELLEEEKVLIRKSSKRLIAASNTSYGEVTFVAAGWGALENPVWARLWAAFEPLAKLNGINPTLALYNWNPSEEIWPGKLSSIPDAIVYTSAPYPEIEDHLFELRKKCPIIAADEKYIGQVDHVVSLDNYEAGRMAANLILEKGRKRPAFVNWMSDYLPFTERQRGFVDALRNGGIELPEEHIKVVASGPSQPSYLNQLIEHCKSIVKNHDSLWIYSDEEINTVYATINEIVPIPDQFSLVTLNSKAQCRRHYPAINAISHATGKIAIELVKLLKKSHENNNDIPETIIKVKPDVYDGETL